MTVHVKRIAAHQYSDGKKKDQNDYHVEIIEKTLAIIIVFTDYYYYCSKTITANNIYILCVTRARERDK